MAFRKTGIDALITVAPAQAAKKIAAAIESCDGNQARTAERLGVAWTTVWRWMGRLKAAGHDLGPALARAREAA